MDHLCGTYDTCQKMLMQYSYDAQQGEVELFALDVERTSDGSSSSDPAYLVAFKRIWEREAHETELDQFRCCARFILDELLSSAYPYRDEKLKEGLQEALVHAQPPQWLWSLWETARLPKHNDP